MSPLYQVILQQDDRPDEIRLHDRPLKLGEHFSLLGHRWEVHGVEDGSSVTLAEPSGARVSARYLCRRAGSPL
jgi:hypothetical protein